MEALQEMVLEDVVDRGVSVKTRALFGLRGGKSAAAEPSSTPRGEGRVLAAAASACSPSGFRSRASSVSCGSVRGRTEGNVYCRFAGVCPVALYSCNACAATPSRRLRSRARMLAFAFSCGRVSRSAVVPVAMAVLRPSMREKLSLK